MPMVRRVSRRLAGAALLFLASATAAGCNNETRVTELEPVSGTFNGGEEVVIRGQGFPRSGAVVKFGTKEAQPVVMESENAIKVYTPAGDKGTKTDVTVIFNDGRAYVLKAAFTYVDSTQGNMTRDKFMQAMEKK